MKTTMKTAFLLITCMMLLLSIGAVAAGGGQVCVKEQPEEHGEPSVTDGDGQMDSPWEDDEDLFPGDQIRNYVN